MRAHPQKPAFLHPFPTQHFSPFVSSSSNSLSRRPPVYRKSIRCSLDRILVFGASRGLGLEVARELSAQTDVSHVTATVRKPEDAKAVSSDSVEIVDALDDERVDKVVSQKFDAVISCFGGEIDDEKRGDYDGNRNLVDALVKYGTKRFVLVSAMGAGDSEESLPFQALRTMRSFLRDKSRAELYVRESGLPYTILRPGPLSEDDYTGTGMLTESRNSYGSIGRYDLAKLICQVVQSENSRDKVLYAVDRTRVLITSPYVRPLEFWESLPFDEFKL